MYRKIVWTKESGDDVFFVGPFENLEQAHDWIDSLVALVVPELNVKWQSVDELPEGAEVYSPDTPIMEIFKARLGI